MRRTPGRRAGVRPQRGKEEIPPDGWAILLRHVTRFECRQTHQGLLGAKRKGYGRNRAERLWRVEDPPMYGLTLTAALSRGDERRA